MAQIFTNNAISRIASAISPISSTINIDPARAGAFPNPSHPDDFFLVTLDDVNDPDIYEIVKCSHRTGAVLHVAERGYEQTIARTWTVDDTLCDHRVTAGTLQTFLPVTKINYFIIPANSVRVVDQFPISSFNLSTKWHVTIIADAIDKVYSLDINALVRDTSTPPKWTKYAALGDKILFTLNIDIIGNILRLSIINNESVDLTINATRIHQL